MDKGSYYHNIFKTFDYHIENNDDCSQALTMLKTLFNKNHFNLETVGYKGIVIFGSYETFQSQLKEKFKNIRDYQGNPIKVPNVSKIRRRIEKLETYNYIYKITRQKLTSENGVNSRLGFSTVFFIFPLEKSIQPSFIKDLKGNQDNNNLLQRYNYLAGTGFKNKELRHKVVLAKNVHKESNEIIIAKGYKKNMIEKLENLRTILKPKTLIKAYKEPKQSSIKELQKQPLIH
tara:strand:- start:172 stop:867 length:696 start_codon:yes stop_codon:yes gene_type:complete